jgi:hypothetical protein
MQEQQSQARAEQDIAARVAHELKQREEAERAEEIKARAAAEERAKKFAAEQKLRTAEAKPAAPVNIGKPTNKLGMAIAGVFVLIAAGLGLLHIIPLSGYVPGVQALMSKRLGAPVTIGTMRYALFPSSQLTLERVNIGKSQEVKVESLAVPIGPVGLLSGKRDFDTVEGKNVTVEPQALSAIAGWTQGAKDAPELMINKLRLRSIKVATPVETPKFDLEASLGPRGELRMAIFNVDKARIEATPKDKSWSIKMSASGWKPIIGPAVEFDELEASGTITGDSALLDSIKGRVGGGTFSAQLKASWGGTIQASGDLKLENGKLLLLMPAFTRNFSALGTLNLTATYALRRNEIKSLFDNMRLDGTFTVAGGELNNVDIVRALQSARAGGQRGGKTRFDTLSGTINVEGNLYSFRQLQLNSGPMNASGAVDINDGVLNGRINAELGTKGVVVARGALAATGTLSNPVLR